MNITIRTHRCTDAPEPRSRHFPSDQPAARRARYAANLEHNRALSRAHYARHRERYAATARERARAKAAAP